MSSIAAIQLKPYLYYLRRQFLINDAPCIQKIPYFSFCHILESITIIAAENNDGNNNKYNITTQTAAYTFYLLDIDHSVIPK